MDTRGNDVLREMLAAEYALGTLRGGARRRFERLARGDAGLQAIALQWSERLAPLIDAIPPTVPPQRVWDAIEARLPGSAARHRPGAGWWDRVALWRGVSAALAAVAVVAVGLAMRPPAVTPPQIVQVETVPTAVATLLDPKSGAPVAVVMASGRGERVTVKVAAGVVVPAGKVLQLWVASKDSEGLKSMGVLSPGARDAAEIVPAVDPATLSRAKAFGLSLEPAGGSPQPTQVLGLGALAQL